MDISYELYKVFYCVASTLSFSEASRQLFISKSAVSQSVKTLEQKLGQQLFIRSTKKVKLTAEGELLFRHIEPAIHMIRNGEAQLTQKNSSGGLLRIGASDTICRYFLVPYLNRFHKEFPDAHIRVMNQTSLGCIDLLESGQVDFVVVNAPNSRLKKNVYTSQVLREFQDVFVANRTHFPLENQELSLGDLTEYPLLMLEQNSTTSEFLHQIFEKQNLHLSPEVELNSNDLLIDLADIGLGIASVPDFMLFNAPKELFVLKLKDKLPKRQLVLVHNEQLPASDAAENFMHYFSLDEDAFSSPMFHAP